MNKESLLHSIDEYIDCNTDAIAKTLSEMVQCKSVNSGEPGTADESVIQTFISGLYSGLEMTVTSEAVNDEKRPNVTGILSGTGGGRDLIFNAHADVVPAGDESKWTYPPFAGIISEGMVHGRGATDCKSGLTNMYWAARTIHDLGIRLKGDCYLISSVGEESAEGGTVGLAAAIKNKKYNNPFAIVCEGSNFEIQPVSTGLMFFDITIKGKTIHIGRKNLASYPQNYGIECGPEVGVDALQKSLPFIRYFYELMTEWNFRFRDSVLGSGGYPLADKTGVGIFTITPVEIRGGTYFGSVMDSVTIRYGVWYPEFADRDKLVEEIKEAVTHLAATDMWLRENPPEMVIPGPPQLWRGYQTDYNHSGIAAMRESTRQVFGTESLVTGHRGVNDATHFGNAGIPVVVYGANHGSSGTHGLNECALILNLVKATKIYAHMMVEWCGVE